MVIRIVNATKKIEKKVIFQELNLEIQKNSIFGLVGTNGAGKTSLIKCIMGIWDVQNGSIFVDGIDTKESSEFRNFTGYVPDDINLPGSYSVKDTVAFYKYAFKSFDEKYFNEINDIYGISKSAKIRELSKGTAAKLAILLNLSIKPSLLIMDEPLSNLDPLARKEMVKILFSDAAQRGTTIFLSSHNLQDIEKFCDAFAILDGGTLKFNGQIDEVKNRIRKVQAVFPDGIPDQISQMEGITSINTSGRIVQFITDNYSDETCKSLEKMGSSLVETIDIGLDEIFFHIMDDTNNKGREVNKNGESA